MPLQLPSDGLQLVLSALSLFASGSAFYINILIRSEILKAKFELVERINAERKEARELYAPIDLVERVEYLERRSRAT